jgi:hypothetical protein
MNVIVPCGRWTVHCANCGERYVEGGRFCGKCGAVRLPDGYSPTTTASSPQVSSEGRSRAFRWGAAVVVILVLAAGSTAAWWFLAGPGADDDAAATAGGGDSATAESTLLETEEEAASTTTEVFIGATPEEIAIAGDIRVWGTFINADQCRRDPMPLQRRIVTFEPDSMTIEAPDDEAYWGLVGSWSRVGPNLFLRTHESARNDGVYLVTHELTVTHSGFSMTTTHVRQSEAVPWCVIEGTYEREDDAAVLLGSLPAPYLLTSLEGIEWTELQTESFAIDVPSLWDDIEIDGFDLLAAVSRIDYLNSASMPGIMVSRWSNNAYVSVEDYSQSLEALEWIPTQHCGDRFEVNPVFEGFVGDVRAWRGCDGIDEAALAQFSGHLLDSGAQFTIVFQAHADIAAGLLDRVLGSLRPIGIG